MVNHPNRSKLTTFTAYGAVSGSALADGDTAEAARALAIADHGVDFDMLTVLGFKVAPPSVDRHALATARPHGRVVIRAAR